MVSHKHVLDTPTSSFAKTIEDLLALEADSVAKEVEEDRKRAQKRATKRHKSVATSAASADTSGTSKRRGRDDSNGLTKKQRPPKNALRKRRKAESTTSSDPIKKQKCARSISTSKQEGMCPYVSPKETKSERFITPASGQRVLVQSDIRSFFSARRIQL